MSAQVKPFMEHSPAWRAKKLAEGVTRQRWDAWRKLSPESRAKTNPVDYGKGKTVQRIVREPIEQALIDRLTKRAVASKAARLGHSGGKVNIRLIQKNVGLLPMSEVRRLSGMTPGAFEAAARHYQGTPNSPFYYN